MDNYKFSVADTSISWMDYAYRRIAICFFFVPVLISSYLLYSYFFGNNAAELSLKNVGWIASLILLSFLMCGFSQKVSVDHLEINAQLLYFGTVIKTKSRAIRNYKSSCIIEDYEIGPNTKIIGRVDYLVLKSKSKTQKDLIVGSYTNKRDPFYLHLESLISVMQLPYLGKRKEAKNLAKFDRAYI